MKKAVLLIIIVFLALAASLSLPGCQSGKTKETSEPLYPAHSSIFVTKEDLYHYLGEQRSQILQGAETEGKIIGGVVPHHLLAGRLIVQFMETVARQEPELVILVGPNHPNLGGKIITGLYDWQTPEGLVKTEAKVVNVLLKKGLAVRDEAALSREHSMGGLVPFIRHFMPQARIVPLILHHDVSIGEIDALLKALQPYLDEKVVIIASVDFSHYLTRREAEEKDKLTLKAMRDFDYPALFKMGNDYLDSPASLAMVFREAERRGIGEFRLLDNTNSGIILKNDIIKTTSYFTLVFVEMEKNEI